MREPATGRLPGQDLQPGNLQVFGIPTQKTTQATPWKIIILNPKNEGGWKKMFLFNLEIFRFQPLVFRGVVSFNKGRFFITKKSCSVSSKT